VGSVVCALAAATPSVAGSIRLATEVRATIERGSLAVVVNLRNSGDEPAHRIEPRVQFGSREARGDSRAVLRPSETMTMSAQIPLDAAVGQWPLVTRVDYTDVNGHPFQALHVALVSTPAATSALIAVVDVDAKLVGTSGTVRARLKSLSETVRELRVRFLVPGGLEVDAPERTLALEPWQDAVAQGTIVNRSAISGSRYPVFVVAEYTDDGGPHATLGHAVVEIRGVDPKYGRTLLVAAAALIAAWVLMLVWRRRRRGDRLPAAVNRPGPGGPPEAGPPAS
jgi:hypothetical protein